MSLGCTSTGGRAYDNIPSYGSTYNVQLGAGSLQLVHGFVGYIHTSRYSVCKFSTSASSFSPLSVTAVLPRWSQVNRLNPFRSFSPASVILVPPRHSISRFFKFF